MNLILSGLFQIAVGVFLAVLLWAIYQRLYREEHLKYWALSWLALVLYIGCGIGYYILLEKKTDHYAAVSLLRLIVSLFGSLQAPLVALAALSLRGKKLQARLIVPIFALPLLCAVAAWSMVYYPIGSNIEYRMAAPRSFLTAIAMAWFAYAFPARETRSQSRSGPVTVIFCLAYAAHEFFFGLGGLGLNIYSGYFSVAAGVLGAVLPLGITIGIVFAVIEDAKNSERRMTTYWEATHDGMILVDAQGIILQVNEAICRMTGKPRSELEEHPFTVCLHPDEGENLLARFKTVAAGRQIEPRIEIPLTLWNGRKRWVDMTVTFVESRKSINCLIIIRDITRRREAEDALKESEKRFSELLANVRLVGVTLDTTGKITYCNDYLLQITGWKREEVLGTNWFQTFTPEGEREERGTIFADAIAGKTSILHNENEILTREGGARLIQWTNTILHDPAGRVSGAASLGTDVTDQKHLEERYRQAQKLEGVGRLAGGIAHDFNNLLTVINGYSELLLGQVQELDPIHEGLEEIQRAGAKASGLTQQLLAFSRKQVLQPKLLDLNGVITDASRMLRRMIGEDVELLTRLDPNLGPVFADEGQIHQVLMNLAVNARDAMPEGGKLTIESANVLIAGTEVDAFTEIQPGSYASIILADTGVGMSQEVKSHLFEPFFTTKEKGKGTGLGLSTVYGIIRQSGGYISVSSEVGKGTSFRMLLPLVKETEDASTALTSENMPRRGTETILLVEDQQEVRKIVVDTLQRFGYEVLEAANGEEAILLSERHHAPIHLMLTDLVMPGITGRVLADRLKATRPGMRVLYMSGYTDRGGVDQGTLDSETAYIQKPFTPHSLAMKIGEFLGQDKARARILVVDDELSIRMLLRRILRNAGYEVMEAANGRIALEKVREGKIDLIITDLVMPEQEGVETIRQLRQSYPHIKVIAMSGAFGGHLLQTAAKMGAQATLMKPVSPAKILQVAQNLLREK